MSTTTREPTKSKPLSPVEFVHRLPEEEKRAVFLVLLREAVAWNGGAALLPIEDEDGLPFGYYVSQQVAKDRWEKLVAEMSPAVREAMTRPLPRDFDPNDCLSDVDLEAIRQAAGRKATESRSSSSSQTTAPA